MISPKNKLLIPANRGSRSSNPNIPNTSSRISRGMPSLSISRTKPINISRIQVSRTSR